MPSKAVVAIGVFDGVHLGHRVLIDYAREIADAAAIRLVAATFEPHPASVLRPDSFQGLLTTTDRRIDLLVEAGVDDVHVMHFDDNLRELTPAEFVEAIIVQRLNAHTVVVGSNFRFGNRATGDVDALRALGNRHGFDVDVVSLVGDDVTWSSTRARTAVLAGDVSSASAILGRPHRLSGEVVHGDHRGRELGYPTANLNVDEFLVIPADGVYSGLLWIERTSHPCAVSIGTNPTFDGVVGRRVEAHVIGRDDLDLYGHRVDLDFLGHVRPMIKFDGIEALLGAMAQDVADAREHISHYVTGLGGDFANDTVRW